MLHLAVYLWLRTGQSKQGNVSNHARELPQEMPRRRRAATRHLRYVSSHDLRCLPSLAPGTDIEATACGKGVLKPFKKQNLTVTIV